MPDSFRECSVYAGRTGLSFISYSSPGDYVTWSGDTRRSSSIGDGSLPSGISGVAERDGGVPIYAAVDNVTQLKRFAV